MGTFPGYYFSVQLYILSLDLYRPVVRHCHNTNVYIQDSNQFHAVCLDTYPPVFYLNNVSKMIIQLVTKYNELHKEIKVVTTKLLHVCSIASI